MTLIKMSDIDLCNKRVLIREDLNVPIKNGIITSDQRLQAALPTLRYALNAGAAVIVLSHLGRPEEGTVDPRFSLQPIAFGTAHRAHASTCGVAEYAPAIAAGPLLLRELEALQYALKNPTKPVVAIVGGAKISSKLSLLRHMLTQVDVLIPGGGIANTFLKAAGHNIGKSLYEEDLLNEARALLSMANDSGRQILLPSDVVVGKSFCDTCPAFNKSLSQVADDDMIMDVGPETIAQYITVLNDAKTILWNGPIGVFEFPQFSYGTRALAIAIANSHAFSIAGGGDTLAAIDLYDLTQEISYISTGGGAFLEYLEGKTLPAVAVLEQRSA